MAALTATSWTITYRGGSKSNSTVITNRKKYVHLKLALASGESPATGVPLPAFGKVGMVRYLDGYSFDNTIDSVAFATDRGAAIKWVLNTTANTLVPMQYVMASGTGTTSGGRVLRSTATALALEGTTFYVTAHGW